ncbi:class I SAM-dependent methyltransferase [Mesorhizobium hawassense]|uniref:class I SAM-dependent methyltransferase n=1 Tax=Mesorhizobium hawassense TaxID=1209954 RepID=UPI00142D8215|nr:class I SAM-dependent methyltransferase [Mesorhizobium hawassense]
MDEEPADGRAPSLRQLYDTHDGKVSDKWPAYLAEYDRIFAQHRDRPVRILEIGVQNGGSLEILARYFPQAAMIVGCDIDPTCGTLRFDDDRIAVVVGDVNDDETERRIVGLAEQFDIVIDDGSHRSADIIRAFARYFPYVAQTGMYIVEDLHCSYWRDYEGGLYDPLSSLSFFKRLVDVINNEHWGLDLPGSQALAVFAEAHNVTFDDAQLASIHAVRFLNSLCIVAKRPTQENRLGARLVEGSVSAVAANMTPLKGTTSKAADQTGNPWSLGSIAGDEEIQTGRELRQKARIDALARDLVEAHSAKATEVEALRAELSAAWATRAGLEGKLAGREMEIRGLKDSTSWRMTAPLRVLSRCARRLLGNIRRP